MRLCPPWHLRGLSAAEPKRWRWSGCWLWLSLTGAWPSRPAHTRSRPPLVGGSLHRADNMLKLLGSVQRQRAEHRKLQRLILDTSGRAQTNFAGHAGAVRGCLCLCAMPGGA